MDAINLKTKAPTDRLDRLFDLRTLRKHRL